MGKVLVRLVLTLAGPLAAPVLAQASQQATSAPAEVRVRTQPGIVSGQVDGDLAIYRGIPFAQPPVGDLRWRAPKPVRPWRGIRPANTFARGCMQVPNAAIKVALPPISEDCLYLNVWAHADADARMPVIVWIHGGGFSVGSTDSPLFDGAALARKGVIFISVQYRLGPFGFLAHPALSRESRQRVSGNYGLLDQIAALRWVKANVAAFGGDPNRVTIMGESAGAMSVSLLAQSPLARGLFSGIIAQSGASFGPAGHPAATLASAEAEGLRFAHALGAHNLKGLRTLSADAVMRATSVGKFPFSLANSWPVIDGYVLPGDPIALYGAGKFNDTPVLIGQNENEGGLFPTASTAQKFVAEVQAEYGPFAARILNAYPANDDAVAAESAKSLFGDATFGVHTYRWARLQSLHGKGQVFQYYFTHTPPQRPGFPAGPIHGAELPYMFDNLATRPLAWTAADRATATLLSTYWTNFAKSGDPNGAGVQVWPAFSADQPLVAYVKDGTATTGPIPQISRMQLLDSVLTDLGKTDATDSKDKQ